MKQKGFIYLGLRLAMYVAVLGAIFYFVYQSPYNPHPESAEDIRRWVAGFGTLAPLMYVGVYTIRPLLLFPTLILNLSAGVLFGPYWGVLFLLMGGMGCASFCYLWGRFGGGRWLLENFGGHWGERLREYLVCSNSFTKLLWLRTVPIFPYDPVSIIAGSVGFDVKKYIGATFLGMLPGAIAYNFLASSFGTNKFYVAILGLVVAFGVPLVWWRRSGESKRLSERQ